jgi:hypothetical protein
MSGGSGFIATIDPRLSVPVEDTAPPARTGLFHARRRRFHFINHNNDLPVNLTGS